MSILAACMRSLGTLSIRFRGHVSIWPVCHCKFSDWPGNIRAIQSPLEYCYGPRLLSTRRPLIVIALDVDDDYRAQRDPLPRAQGTLETPCFILVFLPSIQRMLRLVSVASRPASSGLLSRVACSDSRNNRISICLRFFFDCGLTVFMFAMKGRRSFSSTSARKADITLTVDGKEVSVPQGATSVH